MDYGYSTRTTPRLQPLRGFNPGNTQGQTRTLPIHPYYAKGGVSPIVSGEAISIAVIGTDSYWVKGRGAALVAANVATLDLDTAVPEDAPVFFAMQDAEDFSVVSSGSLLGLDTNGNYTLATAFFNLDGVTAAEYTDTTALKVVSAAAGEGKVTPVEAADVLDTGERLVSVVGYVNGGVKNVADHIDEAAYTYDNNGNPITNMLVFNTTFQPATI